MRGLREAADRNPREPWLELGLAALPDLVRGFIAEAEALAQPERFFRSFPWIGRGCPCDGWRLLARLERQSEGYVDKSSHDYTDPLSGCLTVARVGDWVLSNRGGIFFVQHPSPPLRFARAPASEAFVRNVHWQARLSKPFLAGEFLLARDKEHDGHFTSIEGEIRRIFFEALGQLRSAKRASEDAARNADAAAGLKAMLSDAPHACPHCGEISTDFRVLGSPVYCVCRSCGRSFSPDQVLKSDDLPPPCQTVDPPRPTSPPGLLYGYFSARQADMGTTVYLDQDDHEVEVSCVSRRQLLPDDSWPDLKFVAMVQKDRFRRGRPDAFFREVSILDALRTCDENRGTGNREGSYSVVGPIEVWWAGNGWYAHALGDGERRSFRVLSLESPETGRYEVAGELREFTYQNPDSATADRIHDMELRVFTAKRLPDT